jgi:hypothetical protein
MGANDELVQSIVMVIYIRIYYGGGGHGAGSRLNKTCGSGAKSSAVRFAGFDLHIGAASRIIILPI